MWTPPPAWLKKLLNDISSVKQIQAQKGNELGDEDLLMEAFAFRKKLETTPPEARDNSIYEEFPRLYNKIFEQEKADNNAAANFVIDSVQGNEPEIPPATKVGEVVFKSPAQMAMEAIEKKVESQKQSNAAALKRSHVEDNIKRIVDNSVAQINKELPAIKEPAKQGELEFKPDNLYSGDIDVTKFDKPKSLNLNPGDYQVGDVIELPNGHYWQSQSKKNSPDAEWDGDFIQKDTDGYWVPVNDPRVTPVEGKAGEKTLEEVVITGVDSKKYQEWLNSQNPGVREFIERSESLDAANIDGERVESTIGKYLYQNPKYAKALEEELADKNNFALKGSVDGAAELVRKAIRRAEGVVDSDLNLGVDELEKNWLNDNGAKFERNNARIGQIDKQLKDLDTRITAVTMDRFRGTQFGGLLDEREKLSREISTHEMVNDLAEFNRIAKFSQGGATIVDTDKELLANLEKKYPGITKNPADALKKSDKYNDYLTKVNRFNKLNGQIGMAANQLQQATAGELLKEREQLVDEYNTIVRDNNEFTKKLKDSGLKDKLDKIEKVEKYTKEADVATSKFGTIYENWIRQQRLNDKGDIFSPLKSFMGGAYRSAINVVRTPFQYTGDFLNATLGVETMTGINRALSALGEGQFDKSITPQRGGGAMDLLESALYATGMSIGIMQGSRTLRRMNVPVMPAEMASTFMTVFPENRRKGIEMGLNGSQLLAYSTAMSAIEARIEAMSPFDRMMEPIEAGAEGVARAIRSVANGSGDVAGIVASLKRVSPKSFIKSAGPEQLEEIYTGIAQGAFETATGKLWDREFNPDYLTGFSPETFASVALTTMILRAPGAFVSPSAATVVKAAAANDFHNTWNAINSVQRELKARNRDVAHLEALKTDILQFIDMKFLPNTTPAQRIALYESNLRIKSLENSKKGMNANMAELVDEQIAEIKKQQKQIASSPEKAEEALNAMTDEVTAELVGSGFFSDEEISALSNELQEEDTNSQEGQVQEGEVPPVPNVAQEPGAVLEGDTDGTGVAAVSAQPVTKGRANQHLLKLAQALQKSAKKMYGIDVEVVYDKYDEELAKMEMPEAKKQILSKRAAGFYNPNTRKVYINPSLATAETPIHEFGHLWTQMAAANRPDILAKGFELIKGTEYEGAVRGEYKDELTNESDILEEALVRAIGENGVGILNEATRGKVQEWIKSIVKYIKDFFDVQKFSAEEVMNMSLEEFLDAVNIEMFTGEIVMSNGAELNSTPTNMNATPDQGILKMMYVGESGVEKLVNAKVESTRILEDLAVAKEMEEKLPEEETLIADDESPFGEGVMVDKFERIRLSTGWFKGADGKWRYEVGFTTGDINNIKTRIDGLKYNQSLKVSEILGSEHQLIKAYPELAELPVTIKKDVGYGQGVFRSSSFSIDMGDSKGDATASTFIHELQHAIQNLEGFARGSNMMEGRNSVWREYIHSLIDSEDYDRANYAASALFESKDGNVPDEYSELERDIEDWTQGVYGMSFKELSYERYRAALGEVEASASELREIPAGLDFYTSPLNPNIKVRLEDPRFFGDVMSEFSVPLYQAQSGVQGEDGRFKMQLAPNGQPSNLTPGQYQQVRTPEFKEWFGDWENSPESASKMLDENGEPKVYYHGTSKDKDFTSFNVPKNGAWFADNPVVASTYANENDSNDVKYDAKTGKWEDKNTAPRVIPVFLNIKRPEFFNQMVTPEQRDKVRYADNYKKYQALYFQNIYFDKPVGERTDGMYYTDDKSVVVVLESPNQIKSAIGNSGEFSQTSNNIKMQLVPGETNVEQLAYQAERIYEDPGFHGGTLGGKSDYLTAGYTGDMPFTGHYFFSDAKRALNRGDRSKGDGNMDIMVVDFSKYNLLRPTTNGYWTLKNNLKRFWTHLSRGGKAAEFIQKIGFDGFGSLTATERIKNVVNRIDEEFEKWNAIELKGYPEYSSKERFETVVLKMAGYEGVDVRFLKESNGDASPDTAQEGSVIFDLKPETMTRLATPEAVASGDIKMQLAAFHGSPHNVDRFSTSKIGSGEGRQAFGWGLYFSSNRDIAKWYSEMREREISSKGGRYPQLADKNLYEVSLFKGTNIDDKAFLQWESPLKDWQTKAIRSLAKKEGVPVQLGGWFSNTPTGSELYNSLTNSLGSQKDASLFLRRAGIPGIIYRIGSMSGAKNIKGSNYVVFDDRDVTIEGKIKMQLAKAPSLTQDNILDITNTFKKNAGKKTPQELVQMATAKYPELANVPELQANLERYAERLMPRKPGGRKGKGPLTQDEIDASIASQRKESITREVLQSTSRFWRKYFTSGEGVGNEYIIEREKSAGFMSHKIREAEDIAKRMLKSIRKNKFTDMDLLDEAMAGDTKADRGAAIAKLPADMQQIAIQMREIVDGLSRDLVINGFVTPSQAFTLLENEGKYFTRAYRSWEQSSWGNKPNLFRKPQVKRKQYEKIWNDAVNFLQAPILREMEKIMPKAEAIARSREEALARAWRIVQGVDHEWGNAKPGSGRRDTSTLMQRDDIPEPIRALMGEYTDPVAKFLVTVYKQAGLESNSQFLAAIKKFGMGKYFFTQNDRPKEAIYDLGSIGNDDWSPLNGIWTTKEMYDWVKGEVNPDGSHRLIEGWKRIIGMVRWGKTVGSFSTQLKNFLQNSMFALMNGHIGIHGNNGAAFGIEVQEMWKYLLGTNKHSQLIAEMEKLDVIDAGFGLTELKQMIGDKGFAAYGSVLYNQITGKEVSPLMAGLVKGYDWMNKTYAKSDNTWKVFGFLNEASRYSKALYGKAYKDLNDEERAVVNESAAEIVKNVYPTYSRVLRAAKELNQVAPVLGNFISFRAESLRVLLNAFKQAGKEMTDDSFAVNIIGFRRMMGIMSYMSVRTAANWVGAKAGGAAVKGLVQPLLLQTLGLGGGSEEEQKTDDITRYVAPWLKSADLVINDNYNGTATVYDISSFDPYNSFFNAMNAASDMDNIGEAAGVAAVGVLAPFFDLEMSTATLKEMLEGTDSYGRPIYSNVDGSIEKMIAALSYGFKKVRPGTWVSVVRLLDANEDGRFAAEAMAQFLGIRSYELNFAKGFSTKIREAESELVVIRQEFNGVWFNPKSTDEERDAIVEETTERYRRVLDKLHEDYTAALRLGTDSEKLENRLNGIYNKQYAGWSPGAVEYIKTRDESLEIFKAPERPE